MREVGPQAHHRAMTSPIPIGFEALQARNDDLRRAAERSRVSAPPPAASRLPTRRRRGRRAVVRWLRLA
jgi:hypothetical protein